MKRKLVIIDIEIKNLEKIEKLHVLALIKLIMKIKTYTFLYL